jgi:hypothetical protein
MPFGLAAMNPRWRGWFSVAGSLRSAGDRRRVPIRTRLFAGRSSRCITSGQSITPAFEGWYRESGRHASMLIGYYNRNQKQILDIPRAEQSCRSGWAGSRSADAFSAGKTVGRFHDHRSEGFRPDKKITWTIVSNGKTTAIPVGLNPLWVISFKDATGNTPPFIGFSGIMARLCKARRAGLPHR